MEMKRPNGRIDFGERDRDKDKGTKKRVRVKVQETNRKTGTPVARGDMTEKRRKLHRTKRGKQKRKKGKKHLEKKKAFRD